MNLFGDFSRYSTIIREEHLPLLKLSLSKIPDFSWLLSDPNQAEQRLQGDLIPDFPTVFLDEQATPRSKDFTVMLLNNTCDLPDGRVDFVTAAPVVDFQKYLAFEREKRGEDSLRGYAEAIRRNDITELMYLPPFGEFGQGGLVLLHLVCSVSTRLYLNTLRRSGRVASFTQMGFYFLLIKLTTHIARPESTEVQRTTAASAL